jgi:hypothetical protein
MLPQPSRRERGLRLISPRLALMSLLSVAVILAAVILAFRVTHAPHPAPVIRNTGPDIRVSHDEFQAHVEPSVAINPRNKRNLLGACQFHGERPPVILGTFASFDGGQTWRDNGPLPLPVGTNWGTDVTVTFDAQGTGYVAAAATAYTPGIGASPIDGIYVWRTTDGGRTFAPPVEVTQGQHLDHPWLAANATLGAPVSRLYLTWDDPAGLAFSQSTDGGHHFAPPRIISAPTGDVPVVASGPAGAVYVAYEPIRQGSDAELEVVSSTDDGQHFGPPSMLGTVPDPPSLPSGAPLPTGPSLAVDQADGAVYVAYVAPAPGTTQSTTLLMAHSTTNGHTWSAPTAVIGIAGGAPIPFQPQMGVDALGGVDVAYFALTNGHIDEMIARSRTQGTSFGPSQRVTSQSFDPALGLEIDIGGKGSGQGSSWWIGDYQGLAVGQDNLLHPFWNDTSTGHLEIFTAAIPALSLL